MNVHTVVTFQHSFQLTWPFLSLQMYFSPYLDVTCSFMTCNRYSRFFTSLYQRLSTPTIFMYFCPPISWLDNHCILPPPPHPTPPHFFYPYLLATNQINVPHHRSTFRHSQNFTTLTPRHSYIPVTATYQTQLHTSHICVLIVFPLLFITYHTYGFRLPLLFQSFHTVVYTIVLIPGHPGGLSAYKNSLARTAVVYTCTSCMFFDG